MIRIIHSYLRDWKTQAARTPLLLRGARQVGKSFAVRAFGTEQFSQLCEVNLELQPTLLACFRSRNAYTICSQLEAMLGCEISDEKSLLFVDEIQDSTDALISLRSFKEQRPNLHVVAAGSLIEFALQDNKEFSFPVGRITFAHMYPLSFREFLIALGEIKCAEIIGQCTEKDSVSEPIHKKLLELVRSYLVVGGMPEVVEVYRKNRSIRDAKRVQTRLISGFAADFSKYGRFYDYKKLNIILNAAPRFVGKQFKYAHISSDIKARDLKQPLLDLERAGLIRLVRASAANGVPIGAEEREGIFKLQFLDVGLMLNQLGVDLFSQPEEQTFFVNEGSLAEQFVGQELLAQSAPEVTERLFYWNREKTGSEAEVDFVIAFEDKVIPLEVKAGTTGRLRSLRQFMSEKSSPIGLRVSQHPFSFVDGIISLPFYMVGEIPRILKTYLK